MAAAVQEEFAHSREELVKKSEQLYKEGLEFYDKQDFEKSVACLEIALKMVIKCFGVMESHCAKFYLWYGKSLLAVVQKESNIFGGEESAPVPIESKEKSVEENSVDEKPVEENPVEIPEKVKEGNDQNKSETKSEETLADDRQLAWENIEIARVISEKDEKDEEAKKLHAECIGALGDIFMENDDYVKAKEEFLKCVELYENIEGVTSRNAASYLVSAGACAIYENNMPVAYELYLKALIMLDQRIRLLIDAKEEEGEEEEDVVLLETEVLNQWLTENKDHKNVKEVKNLKMFCDDLSERLDTLQDEPPVSQEQIQAAVQAQMEELAQQLESEEQKNDSANDPPVNNVMVRSKNESKKDESNKDESNKDESKKEESVNDLGVARSGTKRKVEDPEDPPAKRQQI